MHAPAQAIDFNERQRPFQAIWEVTQACDLACVHCRASAQPEHHPLELSTEEGKRLSRCFRGFALHAQAQPSMILTGLRAITNERTSGMRRSRISIRGGSRQAA